MRVLPMKNLVTRKGWGARPPRPGRERLALMEVKGLCFHYSGMDADEQADHKNCAARVRGIQRFHMDSRGWLDIAYNFLVCKHGHIFQGRGWYVRSAAQGTNAGNDQFVAVCFLGDDSKGHKDLTPEAIDAFRRISKRFRVWYGKRPVHMAHSDFTGTACPGDEIRAALKDL